MNKDHLSCIMVIFGGTGDLTHRKLIPALYMLEDEKILPSNFAVVAVGRRDKTNESYRQELLESARKHLRVPVKEEIWSKIRDKIYYQRFNISNEGGYTDLNVLLQSLDKKYQTGGNRLYYLAVAPEYFAVITEQLQRHKMVEKEGSWQRLVIEKPFGEDLGSAQRLNKIITDVFTEENTYRIDHYLGKEMLQNIMVIRFANALFEPIWNSKYIDNIQISAMETVGVENRAGYYEKTGVLRDMVQNHMLQFLTLIAMEPPVSLDTESIRDEKVKVLRSVKEITPQYVVDNVIRGQYGPGEILGKGVKGYRQEEGVDSNSVTETFLGLKLYVDNFRWAGMPFYIRSGKKMPVKSAEVIIQFKQALNVLYYKEYEDLNPSLLVIKIQPQEGIFLQFNAKKPGTQNVVVPVKMDFCQNCEFHTNSPEAYERLLYDVMRGDSTLFTRWDEVEYSWGLVDSISGAWKDYPPPIFPNYAAGSWGPQEAWELLRKEGRKWWNTEEVIGNEDS